MISSLVALVVCAVAWHQSRQHGGRRILTTAEELHRLRSDEGGYGNAVRLRGVVTHYNWRSRLLVLQDATGGIPVEISTPPASLGVGHILELEGFTSPGDSSAIIVRPRLKPLGTGQLPPPRLVSPRQLASGAQDYAWVEVQGIVRSAEVQPDTFLKLDVVSHEGSFTALVSAYEGLEFSSIVDAGVRIRGVAHTVFSAKGEVIRVQLLVPSQSQISVVEPVPADPFAIPARPIRELPRLPAGQASGHRVRVRGVVVRDVPGQGLIVKDDTGELYVRPSRRIPIEPGDHVDVLGFVATTDDPAPVLEHAALRPIGVADMAAPTGSTETQPHSVPTRKPRTLTTVAEIRELTGEEADRGYAVRLRAVVTYYDPEWSVMFVQDPTGGIYVDANGVKPFATAAGQAVEVEGSSDAGGFAPQIVNPRVRVLGPGALPDDPHVSLEELFSGRQDSQWVEAEGVVQSVSEDEQHVWLDIVAGLYRFKAHTADLSDRAFLASLVDARIRVRGACGTVFNEQNQLVGIQIYVPDLGHLSVSRPGPADPFLAAVRPIASLLQFSTANAPGHRVRVRGVVTLQQTVGLFVTDETGGVFVEAAETDALRPGDHVEAVGFPAPGEFAPILRGAVFRRVGSGRPPTPIPVTAADASSGNYDARLVRIQAYLLDRVEHSGEEILTLQAGKSVFSALLQDYPAGSLDSLRRGSLLELTGVCSVQADSVRDAVVPRSLRILLRTPADVAIVEAEPWWTLRRALAGGGVLAAGFLGALAWGATLRKRVRAQTERIRREMERQTALQRRYAELFENANDIVFAHDLEGRISSINGAGERVTGYTRNECLGKDVFELVAPEQRELVRETIERALAGKAPSPYEVQWIAKDGRRLTLEVSARPVHRDGSPAGIEAIARDVTERNQLEGQFRQAQKMEAIGRLAGGVAHDFNNLLGVITGYGELMRRQVPERHPARGRLEEIMKAAERAAGLTRQLLAFSRKQVLQPRLVDLNVVVGDMDKMLQRVLGEDILLETRAAEALGAVKVDPSQVEQVIMNLVVNARDAMPSGGRLTIETADAELDQAYAAMHPPANPGRYVMLAVSDTGMGMDAETQRHIFEPFFTTKPEGMGTGLGLATVYGIVKQSGGYVWVYSEVGRGTTFKVYLPRVEEAATVEAPAAVAVDLSLGSEVVLLVEDENALRALVREVMESAGYIVLEARQASEAIRICEEHDGAIALVLTDVVMPGMSGPELLERVARLRPEVKVLYMSGYTDGSIARHGILEPGTPLIEKPFTSRALGRKVRQVLDGAVRTGRTWPGRAEEAAEIQRDGGALPVAAT